MYVVCFAAAFSQAQPPRDCRAVEAMEASARFQTGKIWIGNLRFAVPKSQVREALVALGCEGIMPHEDAVVVRNGRHAAASFGFVTFGYAEQALCPRTDYELITN